MSLKILFLFLINSQVVFTLKGCTNVVEDLVCLKNDRYSPPPLPILINSTIFLNKILEVDEEANSIVLSLELTAYWQDFELQFANDSLEYVQLPQGAINTVWHPQLNFEDLLSYKLATSFGDSHKPSFYLGTDNILEYSEEFKITISCDFDFSDFPFDENDCNMTYGDDEHGTSGLQLQSAIVAYGDLATSENEQPIVLGHISTDFTYELKPVPSFIVSFDKDFSYTGMTITLKRKSLGLLISGFYYPTTAFALFSTVSFLINPESVPGRMGMIVTLYLISANVYNSVKAPPNRGFSVIEVWMIGSQIPIIIALLEYGYILHLKKKAKAKKVNGMYQTDEEDMEKLRQLDYLTMILSLAAFLLFAAIYWIVLLV